MISYDDIINTKTTFCAQPSDFLFAVPDPTHRGNNPTATIDSLEK
jgi:hypothetical protein